MHRLTWLVPAAVLRSLLQGLKEGTLARPPLPTPGMSPVEAAERLAVAASHPTWVVFRWLQRWGQDETVKLLDYNNRQATGKETTDSTM